MTSLNIAAKLSLVTLTGSAAVLALTVGYNYASARRTLVANAEAQARTLAAATVHRVESVLRPTERVASDLAAVLETATLPEADVVALLRRAVESNDAIYGMTVAFEPFAFDKRAEYYAPYFYKPGNGLQFRWLGDRTYRYFLMDWYQIPRETDRPQWTEPYYDVGGGNAIMSTYAVPFYATVDGRRQFRGVVTADVSLDWLRATVSAIRVLDTGFAFLISRNGTVVTHPIASLMMNETLFSIAEARRDPQLRAIGRAMLAGDSGFVHTTCVGSDSRCWLVYAPIPANGWALGALFPEGELFADVHRLSRIMLVLGGAGSLLLLVVVVAVARSATRPLTALARATHEIARGEFDGYVPPATARDEVGELATAFTRMQGDLRRYVADLKHTSAEREQALAQLAEYNRTLAQKVDERTAELRGKNAELEATLKRLTDTQAQLLMQEKLASLGQLTAGVAHEIKNPLNFVTNFAQLSIGLVQDVRDLLTTPGTRLDDATRTDLEAVLTDLDTNARKINEHGLRADRIVRDMLQHSRGGAAEWQPTDLNALVAQYVNLAYHGQRGRDAGFTATIETAYDPQVGTVAVVPHDLGRAVLNLVDNAFDAASEKAHRLGPAFTPVVRVTTQVVGPRVEIRVRDNGDGVPVAIRDKIFQPFFTTKAPGRGTGLGLSITYDIIVEQHRGEMRVDSAEGHFAEFVISLPREPHAAAA